jgi:AcrR family transcriptional regulator
MRTGIHIARKCPGWGQKLALFAPVVLIAAGVNNMPSKTHPAASGSKTAAIHKLAKEGVSERHLEIINAAAALFAQRGYRATSMRDIAEQVGLLGGSLYHHVKSKDALFLEVHDLALQRAAELILEAVARQKDPWARLETACICLLEIQLDPNSITMPLMNDLRAVPRDVKIALIARRDAFEQVFVNLVDDLDLDPRLHRSLYRILLLNLLNTANSWFRPGQLTPAEIGIEIMKIFRHEAEIQPRRESLD